MKKVQLLEFIADSTDGHAYYQCQCGNTVERLKQHVKTSRTISCGCTTKDGRMNLGHKKSHKLYNIWSVHHRNAFPSFELFVAELGNPPFPGATVVPLVKGTVACPGNIGWGKPLFEHGNDRLNPELFMPLDPQRFGQYNIQAYELEAEENSYIHSLNRLTRQYDKLRLEYENDPVKLEEEIERLSHTEGVNKFERSETKAQLKGRSNQSTVWAHFKEELMPTVIERLQMIHRTAVANKSGFHFTVINPIFESNLIGLPEIAHIGITCLLDALGDGLGFKTPLIRVFKTIGQRVDDQCYLQWWEAYHPTEFEYVQKYLLSSNSNYTNKINKSVRWLEENIKEPKGEPYQRISKRKDTSGTHIGDEPLVHIGEWVFQAVQSCTQWFACEKLWGSTQGKPTGSHKQYYLGLSEEGLRWKDLINQGIKELLFEAQPMVIEPRPWPEELYKGAHGGYLKPQPLNFSKLVHNNRGGTVPSPEAIRALNKMQGTPWKINKFMYNVLCSLLGKNIKIGKFVCHERNEFLDQNWPDIHPSVWMLPKSSNEYRSAKAKISRIHSKEKENQQLADNPFRCLKTAAKFLNYDRIFFPAFFDNRTRAYYLHTSGLSPQGANYAKSLLLFADALPVTDENREAVRRDLLISLSNCWGNDKVSLDDRVSFAEKLAADHEWVAKEPLAAGAMAAWTGCSEPWVYLATLRQYHEIFTWKTRTDTDIPNGRDASSSGLQLMGSLLRDEKSMRFTNVIPGDKPADLYAEVARHSQALLENEQWLREQLEKRHKSAEKKAEKYGKPLKTDNITFNLDPQEHISRKTTKRAVMTDSYNASVRSKAEYVSEELMSLEAELGRKVTLAEKAIVTSAIIQGQAQAFPVCVIIKKFCKDIVLDVIGRQEKTTITWSTPCGSKLSQRYNKKQIKQIQTYAMGGTTVKHSKRSNSEVKGDAIWLSLQVDSDDIDGARHTSAFSPNLHHSYDAYISQQTILGMGDKPVGAIHDCWCGRAGETQELVDCAKRAFLKLVTSDVLERLVEANGAEVTVPRFGDDNLLDNAMDSDFMFA